MKFSSIFILSFAVISIISCGRTAETSELLQQEQQALTLQETTVTESIIDDENTETLSEELAETNEKKLETIKEEAKEVVNRKRAKLSFNEKEFNYGMIAQGDEVQHDFVFTNTGDADLVIKSADATCGCTTPEYPFVPIKPGETGKIGVKFNSTGKLGPQKPMVTLVTNASPRVHRIYLNGFVNAAPKEAPSELIEEDVQIEEEGNVAKGEEETIDN